MAVFDYVLKVIIYVWSKSQELQDKSVKLDRSEHYLLFCSVSVGMLFVNVGQGRHRCVVIYHLTAFYHSSAADGKL